MTRSLLYRDNRPIPKHPDPTSHATASFNTPAALDRLVCAFMEQEFKRGANVDVRLHSLGRDENGKNMVFMEPLGDSRAPGVTIDWEGKLKKTELKGIDAMRVKYQGLMSGQKTNEDRVEGGRERAAIVAVDEKLVGVGEEEKKLVGLGLGLEDTDSDDTAMVEEKKADGKGKKKKNKKKGKKRRGGAVQSGENSDKKDEQEIEHMLQVEVVEDTVSELDDATRSENEGDHPITPTTPKAPSISRLVAIPAIQIESPSSDGLYGDIDTPKKSPVVIIPPPEAKLASMLTPRAATPILPQQHMEDDERECTEDTPTPPLNDTSPFNTYTDINSPLEQGEPVAPGLPVFTPELTPPSSPQNTTPVVSIPQTILQPGGSIILPPNRNTVIPLPLPAIRRSLSPVPLPIIEYPPTPPMSANVHPLTHSWTLYYLNSSPADTADKSRTTKSSTDYSHGLVKLSTVSTLEDFFGTWKSLRRQIAHAKGRAIEPPHQNIAAGAAGLGIGVLPDDSNFNLFREGVLPMWEDPMCAKGGKIMLAGSANTMDQLFLEVILLVIGGTLEDNLPAISPGVSNMIIGVVLSRRKSASRLEIWLGGADEPELAWVKGVEKALQVLLRSEKIFPYRGFREGQAKMR